MDDLDINYCYYCNRSGVLLCSLYAPGTYFICDDCIKKTEERDDTVAVFFYSSGLRFVSHDEADRLGIDPIKDSE